jgi:hypothetical protein
VTARPERVALKQAADALIAEVDSSRWDHVPALGTRPVAQWTEVLLELERRCPGHPQDAYVDALARAQWNNR